MLLKLFLGATLLFSVSFFSAKAAVSAPEGKEILVSGAISLKNAFAEIGAIYEKQTGTRVRFNLGASGLLQRQIETAAPVDVFASAGEKQMDELQAGGYIIKETRHNFARNALVLMVPSRSNFPLHSFADLARPEVERVAIGNPKTVPAGQYAKQALTYLKVWERIQSRLVLAENARQVLDYISRGEVEAGIVYASDVTAAQGKAVVVARAPEISHDRILYPIAIVKETANRGMAQHFIDLILSDSGQAILRKYGFLSVR